MINQVTIVGRLTRDPEAKVTSEGIHVAHITLAVNRPYRNQNGELEADFISCTLWRKAAQNTAQYCRKGSVVGITGRIQTRHYDTQEGKRIYITEVIADTVRFLSSKPQSETQTQTKEKRIEEELPF
ncbi:MAG TPA: single-stranded DNA-binding protein [Candidatus Angelobacter sp.]|nr:single-stranded DNA-binding protein [Candidatus Angelobacter sp.]